MTHDYKRHGTTTLFAALDVLKTLAGFDFQPSLDRNRIIVLAGLDFINRAEVIHLLGPPGTGKSHLATALAVEAVRAGKSVYFIPLADLIAALAKAEREGTLREKSREMKQRAAVEPVIDHTKAERRMGRNYLKGRDGDRSNAVLATAGYSFSLLLRSLARLLRALIRALLLAPRPLQIG